MKTKLLKILLAALCLFIASAFGQFLIPPILAQIGGGGSGGVAPGYFAKAESLNKAFVSLQGNDTTAKLGHRSLPFKTVLAAYNAIKAITPALGEIIFTDAFNDPPAPYSFFSFDWTGDWSSGIGLSADGYANDPASVNIRLVGPTRQTINMFCTNVYVKLSTDSGDTNLFAGADVTLTSISGARWYLDLSQETPSTASTITINGGKFATVDYTATAGKSPVINLHNIEELQEIAIQNFSSGTIGAISLYNCWLPAGASISVIGKSSGAFGNFFISGGGVLDDSGATITLSRHSAAITANLNGVVGAARTTNLAISVDSSSGAYGLNNCTGFSFDDTAGGSNTVALRGCENNTLALASSSTLATGKSFPIVAAGTAYTLTASYAALAFGTTNPSITLAEPGTYLICATMQTDFIGATYAAVGQSIDYKLSRTNNTPADLSGGGPFGAPIPVMTALTAGGPSIAIASVIYTTKNSNDAITIKGLVTATPSAGSVACSSATISAIKL